MTFRNNCFFNDKIAWLIKGLSFLSVALFLSFSHLATAGMVWQTTNAPINKDGSIVIANSKAAGATGAAVSIDYNDPTPNPCHREKSCKVVVGVSHNRELQSAWPYVESTLNTQWAGSGGTGASTVIPAMLDAKTMGELYTILRSHGLFAGLSVSGYSVPYYCDPVLPGAKCNVKNRWEAYSKVCYALAYMTYSSAYYISMPGQGCIGPTPPNNECKVDTGSVILDHGELTADAVNGHRKNESVRISCTYPANANLAVYSKDANEKIMLKADGSLYSTVTIDGVSGVSGKTINIPQGGATINLESTLHTLGKVEAGPFSGSAILVVNNY
ncbi:MULTISPECIES: PapG chaperone-binding domain-containing protein [unclassified Serratia (in: enterobacteria)]|uniref:MrpH family fimbial adhesin n=1 Tax=Serratia TaxID=613 RepID=UPI0012FD8FDC|nr:MULTISPECIES: PapG chaperone-binding domain-containing protein [unclassified Serratia (in: enterobacteria)]HEI8819793.1 hypothetical protein [Serratia marcescens]